MELLWDSRTKFCSNGPGHMTKMATMPVYGKNLKKSSSLVWVIVVFTSISKVAACHYEKLSIAEGIKMLDLTLSLLLLLKQNIGYKTFFSPQNVMFSYL